MDVATFVLGWGQPRVEDMAISKDKEPLRKRFNLVEARQGKEASGYPASQWHRCFPNVLPPTKPLHSYLPRL